MEWGGADHLSVSVIRQSHPNAVTPWWVETDILGGLTDIRLGPSLIFLCGVNVVTCDH